MKRILIVGGVAGGASAAARARRVSEEAEIVMFERGEFVSFANCGLPYHIGGDIPNRDALLLQTPLSFKRRFNVDVRVFHDVIEIDKASKSLLVRNLQTGEERREPYDVLLLSPGAVPIRPPFPGIDSPGVHTLRNIPDMDRILAALHHDKPRHVTVVGGGFIGLEMMEALHQRMPVGVDRQHRHRPHRRAPLTPLAWPPLPQPRDPHRPAVLPPDRPAHRLPRLVAGLVQHLGRDDA